MIESFVNSSWQTLLEMSPYLLFGFLVAGILSEFISPAAVERHLGSRGFGSIFKAAVMGIPLPLCSCGVIPVTASIRRHGASRGATLSFLLSTPQTGVDSIMVTYSLLGGVFAFVRPLVALVCGLFGGILAEAFDGGEDIRFNGLKDFGGNGNSDKNADFSAADPALRDNRGDGIIERAHRAMKYGFITIPADIAVSLTIGILLAGAISATVPQGYLETLMGKGIAAKVVMMAVGIPLYVCATASVPIAAALMAKGVSAGAALVFLMTGPVTNAASVTMVTRILGARTTVVYLFVVVVVSLGAGTVMDMGSYDFSTVVSACLHHEGPASAWKIASGLLIVAVLVYSRLFFREDGPRDASAGTEVYCALSCACSGVGNSNGEGALPNTEEVVLQVAGMTCSHCEAAVVRNLGEIPGVVSVRADRVANMVVVTGRGLDKRKISEAIETLGYRVGNSG